MAAADDDIVWPLTGNDNLIVVGLAPEDDDGTGEDAAALFSINVGSGSAAPTLIDLDGNGGDGDWEPARLQLQQLCSICC